MARNTLGMILAGLGGGLTGYGQEKDRKAKREEEARQREFSEGLMLRREGFEPQDLAKTRAERLGQAFSSVVVPGPNISVPMDRRAVAMADYMGGDAMETGGGQSYVKRASMMPSAIAAQKQMTETSAARAEAEQLAKILSQTNLPKALKDAVLGGQMTMSQALSEQRLSAPKPDGAGGAEKPAGMSVTGLRTRQNIAADEAERFLYDAGGDLEQAIRLYTQNPPRDLTEAQIPLRREDFERAKTQQAIRASRGASDLDLFGPSSNPASPVPANAGNRVVTDMQRADRYEELRRQGMSPETAQAQVLREMPR